MREFSVLGLFYFMKLLFCHLGSESTLITLVSVSRIATMDVDVPYVASYSKYDVVMLISVVRV